MINVQRFRLDIKQTIINRLRVVSGDTANRFVITVTDDKQSITLDEDLDKVIAVFTRADGAIFTQDAETGVSFTENGEVTIDVRPSSYRTGSNKITLQIYHRDNEQDEFYPFLITTQEQTFIARASAIPEAGAPNAPSQLPMLEGLIEDAGNAVDACEAATAAANEAASSANAAAAAANTAAQGANAASVVANSAASTATSAALAADSAAQNADAKAAEAETAAAAANEAIAAAQELVKHFVYTVPHTDGTWTDDEYSCRSTVTTAELLRIMQTASLCIQLQIPLQSSSVSGLISLFEISRVSLNSPAFHGVQVNLQSVEPVEDYHYTAQFTLDYRNQTVTASISAQRTEKSPEDVYVLEFQNGTWNGNAFSADVTLSATELDKFLNARIIMTSIPAEAGYDIYVLYGATHSDDYDFITLSSIPDSLGNYMYLELQHRDGDIMAAGSIKQLSSLPDYSRNDWGKYLHINSNTGDLEWASLPVYNGGVS